MTTNPPTAKPTNPLVRITGLSDIMKREAAVPPTGGVLTGQEVESALAGHVRKAWMNNKLAKECIDRKLLRDLRARRGLYSPDEIAMLQNNGGVNMVWADLTETKCKAASAWIRDIVLPVGEQPWGVEPTPLPDLPLPFKKAVVAKALAQAQATMQQISQAGGGIMDPGEFRDYVMQLGEQLKDQAELTMERIAKARAARMEKVISDRLVEGGYVTAMDGFIEDFVTYPAALLKGPFYAHKKQLTWTADWKPVVKANVIPKWKRVSPFDAYPQAGTASPQNGDFIERERFHRAELEAYKGLPGYKDDQIDGALRDYANGHIEGWLWTEAERQRLEQETAFMWLSPPGVIDALNYWGSVPGWKLMSWGVTQDGDGKEMEETREYECNVLLCGRYVLYAALNPNPMSVRPYRKACYDEIPGAFWGRSIPDLVSTPQKMVNGACCAMADNMGIASGPQVWVHVDRLADGEQSLEMFPWKQWQLKSDPTQGTNPGIGFFQPDDRVTELNALYEKWEVRADDVSGIPRYTYGNEQVGGAGNTLGGLHTLMGNAAKGLRRAIFSIDQNVIGPTIEDTYNNELQYNPDTSLKGDDRIVPRGSAAILIRESAQQRQLQFLTLTANPIDAPIIGPKKRAALLREVAKSLELDADAVVPTDDEIDQQMQQHAQAMQASAQQLQAMQDQKEQAIAQREQSAQQTKAIGGIVQSAIQAALSKNQQTADAGV